MALNTGITDPFSVSQLTADYFSISDSLQQQGYEVQTITLTGDTASARPYADRTRVDPPKVKRIGSNGPSSHNMDFKVRCSVIVNVPNGDYDFNVQSPEVDDRSEH